MTESVFAVILGGPGQGKHNITTAQLSSPSTTPAMLGPRVKDAAAAGELVSTQSSVVCYYYLPSC